MTAPWIVEQSEVLQETRIFKLRRDLCRDPEERAAYPVFVAEADDWCNVIALTESRELVLVEQWRFGIRSPSLEIPGGIVARGEDPGVAAARELLEETGYEALSLVRIGVVHPNPAIFSNRCFTYLAENVRRAAAVHENPDAMERVEVRLVPEREIDRLVGEGAITHALVLAAFLFYGLWKLR